MIKKLLYTFEILILAAIFFVAGNLFSASDSISPNTDLFRLQSKYSQYIEKKLTGLLEKVVGPGNAETSVQIFLKNSNQTITHTQDTSYGKITTTTTNQGLTLAQQHITVLVNKIKNADFLTYKNLIEGATGINTELGDTLSIQITPFYRVPFFTFGLSRLTLIRVAGIFSLLFLILLICLITLYLKEKEIEIKQPFFFSGTKQISETVPSNSSNDWDFLNNLSDTELKKLLTYIDKETLVYALQLAPLKVHRVIAQNLPMASWNALSELYNKTPFSFTKSQENLALIKKTLELLKNRKN